MTRATPLARTTVTSPRTVQRIAAASLAVLAALVLAAAGYWWGVSQAPTSADATRAHDAAESRAFTQSRADASRRAYRAAYAAAFAGGEKTGQNAGRTAGTKAGSISGRRAALAATRRAS